MVNKFEFLHCAKTCQDLTGLDIVSKPPRPKGGRPKGSGPVNRGGTELANCNYGLMPDHFLRENLNTIIFYNLLVTFRIVRNVKVLQINILCSPTDKTGR
jgi:hypothetical protein